MPSKEHWERVYETKATDAVSWFQPRAERSLRLIRETGVPRDAAIIDVGGGTSTLVDELLRQGYSKLTVLDLSAAALAKSKERIGEQVGRVTWIEADITQATLPEVTYDVWHDRAAFHFLTDPHQRQAYVRAALRSIKPGGHVIVATFAEDGPMKCSGLPVQRYCAETLHEEFGEAFTLIRHVNEAHQTPFDTVQEFMYCYFQRT
jgi:ubiquinone/menaquinone biosynthesis C-methylase UbiE